MVKRIFVPSLAALLWSAQLSLSATAEDSPRPYQFAQTEEFTLKSAAGESYRIMVSSPGTEPPASGHPVAYVLDGDDLFPAMTSLLRLQAGSAKSAKHNGIVPGIIVGIGYGNSSRRDFDYTPDAPAGTPETYLNGTPYPERKYGGASRFLEFVETVLKPEIEKRYVIDNGRQSLVGNGFGGLFALHVLFKSHPSFQTYIVSSPSIWWNDNYILKEEKAFAASMVAERAQARLILTVGDLEQSLTRVESAWQERDREEHRLKVTRRKMVDQTREMAWRLEELESRGLNVEFRSFPGESHKSVVPMALNHALRFAFPFRD